MHRGRFNAELNLALGDKLTLVNKGFVQSLCLRFRGARQGAEFAYADNLAETRRLMQLIREMQCRGLLLDPDGATESPDRGQPDLQAQETAVWLSDLDLVTRNLESLRRAKDVLETSVPAGEQSPGIDRLIEEGAAFVAELRTRAETTGNLEMPDLSRPASDAEGNSLEDFLVSLKDTDERFLAGRSETKRPQHKPLFSVLNTVLCNQFLAIEQFFLQGFRLVECNERALGEARIKHSVDEMTGAFRIVQRITLLGSVPQPVFLHEIRLPHRVKVGSTSLAAIRNDLELTENLITTLEGAKASAEAASEPQTVAILSLSLETERNARRWLSDQFERLSKGGASPDAGGHFETMLARWAVT